RRPPPPIPPRRRPTTPTRPRRQSPAGPPSSPTPHRRRRSSPSRTTTTSPPPRSSPAWTIWPRTSWPRGRPTSGPTGHGCRSSAASPSRGPAEVEAARPAGTRDAARLAALAAAAVAELTPMRGGEIWARQAARTLPVHAELAAALDDPNHLLVVGEVDDC